VFLHYASTDIRAFKIPLVELDTIGFEIYEYNSKMPKWLQSLTKSYDDNIKRELRFLKKHNLSADRDYILETSDASDEMVAIGHYITRLAMYKLVANHYGPRFIDSIISRITQILYWFDDYKKTNKSRYVETLRQTISNLNDDITRLRTNAHPMNIIAFSNDNYAQDYIGSYGDDSPIKSDSIMKDHEYSDELYSIHRLIETNINKVDIRISELHNKLSCITTKIDDIVGSISVNNTYGSIINDDNESEDSRLNVDYDDIDNISDRPSYNIDLDEPVVEHINDIFREFNECRNSDLSSIPLLQSN
jgi:hypothetical protein